MQPHEKQWLSLCRRELLKRSGFGLGAIALGTLLGGDRVRAAAPGHAVPSSTPKGDAPPDPLAPRRPHAPARAKRVIYLHMIGAPSHLDLFDPKPELVKHDGQPCPEELLKGRRFAFIGG